MRVEGGVRVVRWDLWLGVGCRMYVDGWVGLVKVQNGRGTRWGYTGG